MIGKCLDGDFRMLALCRAAGVTQLPREHTWQASLGYQGSARCQQPWRNPYSDFCLTADKYSLLMHCIKIKSPAKFLLNEQYVFVGGNIYFLCVLSCSFEEA